MTEHAFKSPFLQTMQARGYIHQITHPAELDAAASAGVDSAPNDRAVNAAAAMVAAMGAPGNASSVHRFGRSAKAALEALVDLRGRPLEVSAPAQGLALTNAGWFSDDGWAIVAAVVAMAIIAKRRKR